MQNVHISTLQDSLNGNAKFCQHNLHPRTYQQWLQVFLRCPELITTFFCDVRNNFYHDDCFIGRKSNDHVRKSPLTNHFSCTDVDRLILAVRSHRKIPRCRFEPATPECGRSTTDHHGAQPLLLPQRKQPSLIYDGGCDWASVRTKPVVTAPTNPSQRFLRPCNMQGTWETGAARARENRCSVTNTGTGVAFKHGGHCEGAHTLR